MSEGELMVEATSEANFGSLSDFLDSLPTQPCPTYPQNRYYCSVCERLNKATARRCQYSKLKSIEDVGATSGESAAEDGNIKFVPMGADAEELSTESTSADTTSDKVAFKVVTPEKADKDYPLFEFVQPKDKKIEPIEMELLEDVAIEFSTSNDDAMEVEALEVEPVDDTDYDDEYGEVTEVEVVEVDEVDEDVVEFSDIEGLPEFKPISEVPEKIEKVPIGPKMKKAKVARKPLKKISKRSVKRKPLALKKKAKKTPKSIPGQQQPSVQPTLQSSTPATKTVLKQPVRSPQLARPTQPGVSSPSRDTFSQPTLAQPTFQPVGQPPERLQPIQSVTPGSTGGTVRRKVQKKVTKMKKVPKKKM
jgi:hypothetical protein